MISVKNTFKHAAVYSGAAMLGRLVGFLMLPFYAHILRGIGYGVIGMLDVGMGFLISLLAWGMQGAIIRLFHDEPDPARKPKVVSTGVIIVGSVSAIIAIPLIFFAKPISGLLLDDPALSNLLIMALFSFIFDMTAQGASAWLLIRSRSVLYASINLMRLIIGLSLNIWFLLIQDMGLNGYFLSALISSFAVAAITVPIVLKDCGASFDREIAHRIRIFMFPLIPGALMSFISRQAERVLVKFQLNMDAVGILEMGYKFPIILAQLITTPFMDSWNTRRYEMADEPGAPIQIGRMYTYYLFLMVYAGLTMAVVIEPILKILTPPEFHLSYRIARVEIVTLILQGSYYHLSFGIFYAKHTALVTKIRSVMSVCKVALSWFFISTWGIYGAAMSAAVIATFMLIIAFKFAQRRYHLVIEWGKISALVGLAIGLFLFLTKSDWSGLSVYGTLSETIIPWASDGLAKTFLGTWKDGKAIQLLSKQTGSIAEVVLKGVGALGFVVLLPIVHEESRLKVMALVKRLSRR
jgi:O-antigen/teichoic acid export membrane protein